jgi:hypothetical protein
MTTKRIKRDDPKQSREFIKKAREIEADEERSGADKLLGRLAKMPPEPRKSGQSKKS